MARYQIILAYDGAGFAGFQRQGSERTVQGEFEETLRTIGWQGPTILAAGRTDTGVHATGQVVAFDLDWGHPSSELLRALNALLPLDVAVRKVSKTLDNFHPRFDALARHYRYRLLCDEVRHPLKERFAWRVWPAPQLETLRQAANLFEGVHDFAAFGSAPKPGGSTMRNLKHIHWQAVDDGLLFDVTGNAFLYHMVRRMVACQVAVAQGNLPLSMLEELLAAPGTPPALPLAPANGLCLVQVVYASQVGFHAAGEDEVELTED